MEAKELRIGNITKQGVVAEIGKYNIYLDSGNGFMDFKCSILDLEPVYLTHEWLIKLGFTQDGDEYSKDRFTIRLNQMRLIIEGFEYDYNGILLGTENFYVHDLQNLYFAIKKEELI